MLPAYIFIILGVALMWYVQDYQNNPEEHEDYPLTFFHLYLLYYMSRWLIIIGVISAISRTLKLLV